MKACVMTMAAGVLSFMAVCAADDKTEKTMQVARCRAVDEKGVQCRHQADAGKEYCWRHRGLVKTMSDAMVDASKGAGQSWASTKQWSTNAWQKTKSGTKAALESTKEAADEVCENLVDMFNGKSAKDKSK